jgi:ubiquinone/menaquinone biosynthesis C-methylase UbiE
MYDHDYALRTLGSRDAMVRGQKEVKKLIQLLGIRPGDKVLDIPCGAGRHSQALAKEGVRVTGLDINPVCLKLAKRERPKVNSPVFKVGNMADLSIYRNQFDVVLNLFTSFGYFSTDRENKKVMKELVGALKPGGRIAVECIDREKLLKIYSPYSFIEENGEWVFIDRKYDPKTRYNEERSVRVQLKSGKAHAYFHRVRLYSQKEMITLMRQCGLVKVRVEENGLRPIYWGVKSVA